MPSAHFTGNDFFEWLSSDARCNYIFRVINLIISDATRAIRLRQQVTAGGTQSQLPKGALLTL